MSTARAWQHSAPRKPRRPGAAAAAVGLNVAFGVALYLCFRFPSAQKMQQVVASLIWIPVPAPLPAPKPLAPQSAARRFASKHRRVSAESLSILAPPAAPVTERPARAPIDWWSEAERVAAERSRAIPERPGADPGINLDLPPPPPSGHHAGETYRDETGAKIVWISDSCYIESDPPLLGTPQALAHAAITRTVCPGASKSSRGDLFKDLPAYRKYHPQ